MKWKSKLWAGSVLHTKRQISVKWALKFVLKEAKPQTERRCRCVCTHDGRGKISESFVVCISRRSTATVINGRKRKTKDRLGLRAQPCAPRQRNLAAWLCECELFLNRDLSHTVINHRATHKLHHLQPREPISGLLTLSSHDECRAPSNIFSFSDEIDQSSNPEKKFRGRVDWVKEQQQTAPCHTPGISSHNKKGKSREKPPFPFFLFLLSYSTWMGKPRLQKQAWSVGSAR